ncbi:MAG: rRNA maturation RNase YbeY [Bacteroidales bacterium]|nr:rRNA maturation RNase YbeY [Bacteroidales bacterium]
MAINFATEDIKFNLPQKLRLKRWITRVIADNGGRVGEVCYLFCSDAHLLTINQTYLDHDTYTDIITFDYVEGNRISGDILISIERVRENAETFNVSFEQELHRVIIHGVLHLLGQGDKTPVEAKQMRSREEQALALWETLK